MSTNPKIEPKTFEDLFKLIRRRERFEDIVLAVDKTFKVNLMKSPKIKKLYENL